MFHLFEFRCVTGNPEHLSRYFMTCQNDFRTAAFFLQKPHQAVFFKHLKPYRAQYLIQNNHVKRPAKFAYLIQFLFVLFFKLCFFRRIHPA